MCVDVVTVCTPTILINFFPPVSHERERVWFCWLNGFARGICLVEVTSDNKNSLRVTLVMLFRILLQSGSFLCLLTPPLYKWVGLVIT